MTQYRVVTRSGDRREYITDTMPSLEEAAAYWRENHNGIPVCYIERREADGEWRLVLPVEYRDMEELGE